MPHFILFLTTPFGLCHQQCQFAVKLQVSYGYGVGFRGFQMRTLGYYRDLGFVSFARCQELSSVVGVILCWKREDISAVTMEESFKFINMVKKIGCLKWVQMSPNQPEGGFCQLFVQVS